MALLPIWNRHFNKSRGGPFGRAWYGYSVRRLRENPAIAGHVFRALIGLG